MTRLFLSAVLLAGQPQGNQFNCHKNYGKPLWEIDKDVYTVIIDLRVNSLHEDVIDNALQGVVAEHILSTGIRT